MRRAALLAITAAVLGVLLFAPAANAGFFGLNYSFTNLSSGDAGKLAQSGAKTVRWTFSFSVTGRGLNPAMRKRIANDSRGRSWPSISTLGPK